MFDRKEYLKVYYTNNKDRLDKKNKKWREDNIETSNRISSVWRARNPEHVLLKSAYHRAKKQGLEFSLAKEDIFIPGVCPILKCEFQPGTMYAPSLDKKDPNRGYTKDNIWVISKKANIMKSNATRDELILFGSWALEHGLD